MTMNKILNFIEMPLHIQKHLGTQSFYSCWGTNAPQLITREHSYLQMETLVSNISQCSNYVSLLRLKETLGIIWVKD